MDDLDRLCDDIQQRAQTLATEAKQLKAQPITPERRHRLHQLKRAMHLLLLQIRRLLQAGQVQ